MRTRVRRNADPLPGLPIADDRPRTRGIRRTAPSATRAGTGHAQQRWDCHRAAATRADRFRIGESDLPELRQ